MEKVIFRNRRDGKIQIEIPNGTAGNKLLNYLMHVKQYQYVGSGMFIIEHTPEKIHTITDKAKELGLQVEGLQ
jgi:hypothetical protein